MPHSPQHDFKAKELDSDLLATPFGAQTNWHVITGSVSSGKTTLVDQLADKGFRTLAEAGRRYFEGEMAKGRTIDEIREDEASLVRPLIDMQLRSERGLRPNDITFLDRAVPDVLAFSRVAGLDPNEFLAECFQHRYASVFLLDRLPLQQDGVRAEDDTTADYLNEWLARDYSTLGYGVVRVPVLSIEDRLTFVLERLSEQGLI